MADNELLKRERFNFLQDKMYEQLSENPVLVVPDPSIKPLDMLPRVDLIELLHFRKKLPKAHV